jgi:hypothetical protein
VFLRLGFLHAQHVGVLLANQSKKPLLAAERRPLALKLMMRMRRSGGNDGRG